MASPLEKLPSLIDFSFVKIGRSIWLRDGAANSNTTEHSRAAITTSSRLTIVVLFWMDAQLRYASKYISEYTKLAPNARILFVLTSSSDLFLNTSEASQTRRVQPVVDVLLSLTASASSPGLSSDDRLHLHLFSNGGCVTLRSIAVAYEKATKKPLPLKSLIMDSCPGQSTLSGAHRAVSYGLPKSLIPRLFAGAAVYIALLWAFAYCRLLGLELPTELAWNASIDTKLIDSRVERCYIYSETDDLISWRDVEEHSLQAEDKGFHVSREKFQGSPHVGHMRLDPLRYWDIVSYYLKIAVK
ncbi:hypothetical protein H112_04397 [Trichophyton rubrum D6]|uniref:DUF829 domain-containing protein n=3 Tax=Trichophyton rubrum TaxID=5551 RepID=A0A178F3I5_TRIRU|nr:uncharacterized protein TERG_04169 [Trichophyton rubrum CBS 118892]EZF22914.1 hypothetical protein H100_04406 [Trichophyton rubrum MR850]EZF41853.1 hypothetical protein H102_04390 [Trichophyton rubrum CBS 100081]EZF52525.1 hypothetical protein H103_04399 [Trichophyton rubrum CBS 288.86]EZF63015.1 hypothetical protein H104_04388 [Trichophyton rubrum CBS 289.86]EZF84437.1 hypothetical protein H110_04392 [Trichophyton rubrum MR1448]EZF95115.1 hypothetical protein H113_04433 [Trichophyton rubr